MSKLELSFRGNAMLVRGNLMTPDRFTPADVAEILELGRFAITQHITGFYEITCEQNPGAEVVRPSIAMMNFGQDTSANPVLSDLGRRLGTGWYTTPDQVHTRLYPYWRAVEKSAFIPEVRLMQPPKKAPSNVMFVRDAPYE